MKTDKFEKFMEENRQQFDLHDAPEGLFDKIETDLENAKKSKTISLTRSQIMKIAAAILIPIFISYITIGKINNEKISKLTSQIEESKTPIDPMLSELIESESYYRALIDEKSQEIYASLSNDPDLIQEIDNMLKDIDNSYKLINSDFNENVNSEAVMEAMVNCQRLKLQTLDEIYKQVKN